MSKESILVLVANDEPLIQQLDAHLLDQHGYQVQSAKNAADGIEAVKHGSVVILKVQTFRTIIENDLPPLHADPVRFKQILFSLLSNAVKSTPEKGRITLRARRVSEIADFKLQIADLKAGVPPPQSTSSNLQSEIGESLEIAVTDTGIGIKAEDLPRLFTEFTQLETTGAQNSEGTASAWP